jgi:DNA-binding protein HU-beta
VKDTNAHVERHQSGFRAKNLSLAGHETGLIIEETTMSKKDLIDAVAAGADITKEKANAAIDALTDAIMKSLKKGEEVSLAPIGKFKVSKREARQGRNPSTGEMVEIKAATVAKFTAAKALKDALN